MEEDVHIFRLRIGAKRRIAYGTMSRFLSTGKHLDIDLLRLRQVPGNFGGGFFNGELARPGMELVGLDRRGTCLLLRVTRFEAFFSEGDNIAPDFPVFHRGRQRHGVARIPLLLYHAGVTAPGMPETRSLR